jgi:hypothetical protein
MAVQAVTADETVTALLTRLARLRDRVAALVEWRSADDPTAGDPLRGLVISDADVHHYLRATAEPRCADVANGGLARQEGAVDQDVNDGLDLGGEGHPGGSAEPEPLADAVVGVAPRDRLDRLARRLGLTELDAAILFIALAPDLDRGFEPLYGYLNDDVSRRRATIGLALDLCGLPATDAVGRDCFHPAAPLSALGLLLVEDRERPFLSRSLRVPDRLVAHLLGDDTTSGALEDYVRPLPVVTAGAYEGDDKRLIGRLAALLADVAPPPVYLREQLEGDGLTCAAAALRSAGRSAMCFAPADQPADSRPHAGNGQGDDADQRFDGYGPVRDLLLEARLLGCAIVVSPLPERPGALIRRLLADAGDVPVIFAGSAPYDPAWCDSDPLVVDVPRLRSGALSVWSAALGIDPSDGAAPELAAIVGSHRLSGERIRRAAKAALELAAFDGAALTAAHLRLAIRQQSASGLMRQGRSGAVRRAASALARAGSPCPAS